MRTMSGLPPLVPQERWPWRIAASAPTRAKCEPGGKLRNELACRNDSGQDGKHGVRWCALDDDFRTLDIGVTEHFGGKTRLSPVLLLPPISKGDHRAAY